MHDLAGVAVLAFHALGHLQLQVLRNGELFCLQITFIVAIYGSVYSSSSSLVGGAVHIGGLQRGLVGVFAFLERFNLLEVLGVLASQILFEHLLHRFLDYIGLASAIVSVYLRGSVALLHFVIY